MKRMRRIGTGLAVLAVLSLAWPSPAYAAETFGVGARPANPRADQPRTQSIFVYDMKPGTTTDDAVLVANNSSQQKVVKLYGVDSVVSSDGAFACAQEADAKKAVGSWIVLERLEVTLQPGESIKVPFTLTTPSKVDVGEHDGCIAVQAIDAVAPRDQNGVALSFRSALRVAVTVPGDLKTNLQADAIKYVVNNDTLVLTPSFTNQGNVSVDADIRTQVNTIFGTPVESIDGTFLVLRDATSTFNFEAKRPFWGGYYTLSTQASYKPLSRSVNGGTTNIVSQTVFVAPHPFALLIETAAIIAIGGFVVWFILRKKRHAERLKFSRHHTMKPGENIQSIGNDYNVSWKLVARVNNLKAPYTLEPGQKLLIPGTRKSRKTK